MRAVTAVLCAAGNLKRAFPTAPEDVLMLRAINDGEQPWCCSCSHGNSILFVPGGEGVSNSVTNRWHICLPVCCVQ